MSIYGYKPQQLPLSLDPVRNPLLPFFYAPLVFLFGIFYLFYAIEQQFYVELKTVKSCTVERNYKKSKTNGLVNTLFRCNEIPGKKFYFINFNNGGKTEEILTELTGTQSEITFYSSLTENHVEKIIHGNQVYIGRKQFNDRSFRFTLSLVIAFLAIGGAANIWLMRYYWKRDGFSMRY